MDVKNSAVPPEWQSVLEAPTGETSHDVSDAVVTRASVSVIIPTKDRRDYLAATVVSTYWRAAEGR